jgi:hypothetical protein
MGYAALLRSLGVRGLTVLAGVSVDPRCSARFWQAWALPIANCPMPIEMQGIQDPRPPLGSRQSAVRGLDCQEHELHPSIQKAGGRTARIC